MRYRLLGPTGLRVSELCLGTMTFGTDWGWGTDADGAAEIVQRYLDAGGNFVDTANLYQETTTEQIVGEILEADRERIVLATKFTLTPHQSMTGDPNAAGMHRKSLMRAVGDSLDRLRTDYLDLLWVHAWDELTPIAETMRGLDDLVRQGIVHYVGVSDWPAWAVAEANALAEARGWTPFAAVQVEYSLIERTVEREIIPYARHAGLSVTPWGPLGGGVLTGKYLDDGPGGRLSDKAPQRAQRNLDIAREVVAVAEEADLTPAQVAIAWLRAQGDDIIPILGASTLSQLEDNLGVLDVQLSHAQLHRLDAVSHISLGFPGDFLARESVRPRIYAGTRSQIDASRESPAHP